MKEAMERIFEKFQKENDFSGVCMITDSQGTIFEECSGMAHRGFQVRNNMDTMFDVASVTKVFTAAAILQLVSKGILRLDDKITDILDLSGTKIPNDVTIANIRI